MGRTCYRAAHSRHKLFRVSLFLVCAEDWLKIRIVLLRIWLYFTVDHWTMGRRDSVMQVSLYQILRRSLSVAEIWIISLAWFLETLPMYWLNECEANTGVMKKRKIHWTYEAVKTNFHCISCALSEKKIYFVFLSHMTWVKYNLKSD